MADDENRSRLFDEIRNFSQRKLKKVETKVTTGSGELLVEKRSPKGLQKIKCDVGNAVGYVVDTKPDLQVGMIIPGLMISSQDVAQDKSLLETYEITHILNLAPGVPNAYEDDYNYKKIEILDLPETDIKQYFDECIDFIQEGIQRGNCLVHCNAGVSRSTTLCCAYLMKQKKMKYKEALATVREARAFAKPNDGFAKQLEEYEDQLFGQMAPPDSSEDKFMARKRAEIEAEKAAISGTVSVKNKLKSFGAQLESVLNQRVQAITPIKLPLKKNVTPVNKQQTTPNKRKKSLANTKDAPPPPPPPPMNLLDSNNNKIGPPPPPPFQNDTTATKKPNKLVKKKSSTTSVPETNHKSSVAPPPPPPPEPVKAKSEHVDETPIKVSAQKKLWETAHKQQQQQQEMNHAKPTPKIVTKPVVVEQPAPQPALTQTNKVGPIKRTNKLATWEKCTPAPVEPVVNNNKTNITKPVATPTVVQPVTASPEPKKKIIIKKNKDANNNLVNSNNNSPVPTRRATRDLAAQIEAAASESNSQSSTPYSSPGPQRRQMHYGRRTSTQPINAAEPAQPTPRKPMWGLRDQVDSLLDTTPSTTPTRCRSPATFQSSNTTPRDSPCHSPSPQPGAVAKKQVFGRVPPRKTSLTGTGAIGANQNSNDLPVVTAPAISSTAKQTNKATPTTMATNQNKLKNKEPEPTPSPAPALTNKWSKPTTTTTPTNNKFDSKANSTSTTTTPAASTSTPASKYDNSEDSGDMIRAGFKKTPLAETKSTNRSIEARKKSKGLNRSSTAEILKLIKTKSKADFGKSMETVDEDVEIEYLLNQLDEAGLDNIDWDEIGLDENEIKDIVEKNKDEETTTTSVDGEESSEQATESDDDDDDESDEQSSDEDSDDDDDDEMEHTVFKPIAPPATTTTVEKVIQPKVIQNQMAQPKVTSTATLTLKPAPPKPNTTGTKLEVESETESEDETETESD